MRPASLVLALLPLALLPSLSRAQLSALRTYNGVDREIEIEVARPRHRGTLSLRLLAPRTAAILAETDVQPGRRDLARLFPTLWKDRSPEVRYVQFCEDGRPWGSALVLQPMLNPVLSRLATDGKTVEFVPDEDGPMFNGYRIYRDAHFVVETSMGTMEFRLRPDAAPNTAWNLRELAKGDLYRDTIFHRVVAKRADGTPFVIQGGDPTGTGSGGPGWAYALEKSTLPHDFGVISIARSTDPNTNGGQFFVALSREGTKHLDGRYAAFGEMVKGAGVLLRIAAVPVGTGDRPKEPPKIHRVRLVDAPPYSPGPAPLKRPAER
jgi:peptidyl-prolyl cis-trans isomerase B (cyclophilin B)